MTDLANREKLSEISNCPAIVTVHAETEADRYPHDLSFWTVLNRQAEACELEILNVDDPFLLMFTSGTTGPAKPLKVPLKALIAFASYMQNAIGLTPEDAFWNIADPGWAYGLYYAIIGPLMLGHSTLFY